MGESLWRDSKAAESPADAQSPFLEKQVPDWPVPASPLAEWPWLQVGASVWLVQCHLCCLAESLKGLASAESRSLVCQKPLWEQQPVTTAFLAGISSCWSEYGGGTPAGDLPALPQVPGACTAAPWCHAALRGPRGFLFPPSQHLAGGPWMGPQHWNQHSWVQILNPSAGSSGTLISLCLSL